MKRLQNNNTESVFIPKLESDNDLKLDEFWCCGTKSRGCGKKLSLLLVQHDSYGFYVCPHCGRRS